MRKLVTALCALVFLSSCDDELKLVSRDFSVTLKSIDGNTAVVGKPINCTLGSRSGQRGSDIDTL